MVAENLFVTAIHQLRKTLGLTQEGMARQLGCTLGSFQRWELGTRIPSGEYLIKMIHMCPDDKCRAAFGLKGGKVDSAALSMLQKIAVRQHRVLQESLAVLEELRAGGSTEAAERLAMMSKVLSNVVAAVLALEKEKPRKR
ncbi:MAG: helix-turn-helix transcriptional regulator [Euryarchaeota archaeon]|nr:helix-turn-helix transcriptional regulator [Euryarchaeota archaeon]